MTRKTKILFVILGIAAGLSAIPFFSGAKEGELKLTVATAASNRVSIRLTNTSSTTFDYYIHPTGKFEKSGIVYVGYSGSVKAHGEEAFDLPIAALSPWHYEVEYTQSVTALFAGKLRMKLCEWALRHNWPRSAGWIRPKRQVKTIYGPEMLGNQPVPETSKQSAP
jgi:hypothetical protein